ncbi:MAG: PilZ domain-containing protein [Candidatus Omnitrophica bacterium]|nr:PilZ domain-containing protein [Candidatus Omnitrophota bacterium]
MILAIQIIIIFVLVFTLLALYREEKRTEKATAPVGRLTQAWEGNERRNFIRIDADVPIRYSLPKGPNNSKVIKTKNISIGGIAMTLNEKLNPHDRLSLQIEIPGSSTPIIVDGEVVWVKEKTDQRDIQGIRYFDIGVEFKDLLTKDKERLFRFINECSRI